MTDKIIILDFGSQYTQVIARRIRECSVYSEILPYSTSASKIASLRPKGIILSGGPASVYQEKAPHPDKKIFKLNVPIMGICYGMQLLVYSHGGKVARSKRREYGRADLAVIDESPLFKGLTKNLVIWNSHGDKVTKLPKGFKAIATTENSSYAVVQKDNIYGLQFHPEVAHTPKGKKIISNFVKGICGCKASWTMRSFIDKTVEDIKAEVGNDRVILGLSGGVDSSVAAALLHKALGNKLQCIFVDNGLLRANEVQAVKNLFSKNLGVKLKVVDASERFLKKLKGVSDPEKKRKIIGREFIEVFDEAAGSVKNAKFLAQGTLYPDVIESVPIDGNPASLIKSLHALR